jgi:hypothetical protein
MWIAHRLAPARQAHTARDPNMSATHAVSGFSRATGPGPAGNLIGRLGDRLRGLLHPNRLLFRSSDAVDELIVARHGPVEIHQTLAGWSLETCVKGEPDQARQTALRRLGNFVSGKHCSKAQLRVARPLVQAAEGAGRWRIRIAVPGLDSDFVAASARNGKVRLCTRKSETLAVISVPGRPTKLAIQHAETAIGHAIAPTRWQPAAGAMLRLHSLPTVLPFLGRFEVAVPLVERIQGSVMPGGRIVFHEGTVQEGVTSSARRCAGQRLRQASGAWNPILISMGLQRLRLCWGSRGRSHRAGFRAEP